MCNAITAITPPITDPILSGLISGCDPKYFTYTNEISQADITSILKKEPFGNVNLYKKMNNNNIHLTF
jgi:hypothetical protein